MSLTMQEGTGVGTSENCNRLGYEHSELLVLGLRGNCFDCGNGKPQVFWNKIEGSSGLTISCTAVCAGEQPSADVATYPLFYQ